MEIEHMAHFPSFYLFLSFFFSYFLLLLSLLPRSFLSLSLSSTSPTDQLCLKGLLLVNCNMCCLAGFKRCQNPPGPTQWQPNPLCGSACVRMGELNIHGFETMVSGHSYQRFLVPNSLCQLPLQYGTICFWQKCQNH